MSLDVYQKLRRYIGDLREFGGLEAQEIAERAGITAAGLSRFMSGEQATVTHAVGAAIEDMHANRAEEIKQRKLTRANELLTDLGCPPVKLN